MAKNDAITAICLAFIRPLVEAFLKKHPEWSQTRLGREAVADPGKVGMMRRGVQLRPATARKILATIEKADPGFSADFARKKLQSEMSHA